MAFPVVGSRNNSVTSANATTHTVDLPADISAGDGLLMAFAIDGADAITVPTGWTRLGVQREVAGWFYKKATGSEGATVTVTAGLGGGEQTTHRTWRFTAASITDWDDVPPAISSQVDSGSDEFPDPPALNAPWTSGADTYWIASYGADDDDLAIAYPTDYTINQVTQGSNTGANTCSDGAAERELSTAGSENPGTFEMSAPEGWGAATIAIAPSGAVGPTTDIIQQSFRWRDTDPTGINANGGGDWAAAKDTDVTEPIQDVDPVSGRVRIGLRNTSGGTINVAYELQYSKDSGGWATVPAMTDPWGGSATQTEVGLAPSSSFINAAATTELLSDAGTFVAGEGRETNPTGSISLATGEDTELEFKLLFRKWSQDGHVPDGTTFDFRLRDVTTGQNLGTYTEVPRLTIGNQAGHIGGAFVETPGNVLVADDDGNLYALIEATDTVGGTFVNELIVMKSTDGGDAWNPLDLAGRPGSTFQDLEAADMHYVAADDKIYIAWHTGGTAHYVEYNTAGHASPDEYGTVEEIDGAITGGGQECIAIIRRASDGVTKVIYADHDGTDQRLSLKSRTSGGTWDGSPTDVDGEAAPIFGVGGGWMAIDSSNVVHMIYAVLPGGTNDGELYHREISTGDSLSGRTGVNDAGTNLDGDSLVQLQPHAPPVIYDDGATEKIAVIFIDDLDDLYFTESAVSTISFITDEAVSDADVMVSLGTSHSVVAALAVDDTDDEFVAVWTDEGDNTLMRTDTRTSAGSWSTDTTELDAAFDVGWERSITFTHSSGNGGARVVGILYDIHVSPGGTGGIKYREIFRAAGGTVVNVGQAIETDTAQPVVTAKTFLPTQAVETDSAFGVVVVKVYPELNQTVETDTAFAIDGIAKTFLPTQAIETDTAQPVVTAKTYPAVGQTVETDSAFAVAVVKVLDVLVGQSAETDTAQVVVAQKTYTVDEAVETDTAFGVVVVKTYTVAQPVATDTALGVTVFTGVTVEVGQPVATDTAFGVSILRVYATGQAVETDTAPGVVTAKTYPAVGQPVETDSALGVVVDKFNAVDVDQAVETDSAFGVSIVKVVVVGQAVETDTALVSSIVQGQTIAVAQAVETDTAQAVVVDRAYTTGQVVETDSAFGVVVVKTYTVGQADETDTALSVTLDIVPTINAGLSVETDTAFGVTITKTYTVGQADETDTANSVLAASPVPEVVWTDGSLAASQQVDGTLDASGSVEGKLGATIRTEGDLIP